MFKKFSTFVAAHKIVSGIVVIILVVGGYYWYKGAHATVTVTKYVIENATQGTIVSSVSATGQVDPVTEIDVKPQVTENVTAVYVQPGDVVTINEPLVQLDTTNEEKALEQAQISYQSSQLALAKLQEVATTTLLSDQESVTKAEQDIASASTTLASDYQNGFDALGAAFVDFQNVMVGLQDVVTGNDISKTQSNPDAYVSLMPNDLQGSTEPYRDTLVADYVNALAAYNQNLADYHAASEASSTAALDALFAETNQTAQDIANTVKAGKDLFNYVVENYPKDVGSPTLPTITTTFQTNLGNYTNTVNGDLSSIGNAITAIENDKDNVSNSALELQEASATLASLVSGPDPLDVQSQQLSIQSSQLSLQTAQQNLAYDTIRSPINGVVSAVDAVVGESVPSPAVSVVGSGDIAEVTLNEIDAAKVALGDPATLTFDALPNLSLAGQVVEIDPVGTVSQGVVNYNVQVSFTQPATTSTDEQVKPGMSVTASIVTQVAQDVIAVPNAAVVTSGGSSYILEPATPVSSSTLAASAAGGVQLDPAPVRVPVTTGLSNDTMTEISTGVNPGDQIITQTIMSAATTASAATGGTSALRLLGGGAAGGGFGGGGGAVRVTTGGATGARTGG
jgi:multidrug efflux pump subunit AcrA (membrane-fusion protein)